MKDVYQLRAHFGPKFGQKLFSKFGSKPARTWTRPVTGPTYNFEPTAAPSMLIWLILYLTD